MRIHDVMQSKKSTTALKWQTRFPIRVPGHRVGLNMGTWEYWQGVVNISSIANVNLRFWGSRPCYILGTTGPSDDFWPVIVSSLTMPPILGMRADGKVCVETCSEEKHLTLDFLRCRWDFGIAPLKVFSCPQCTGNPPLKALISQMREAQDPEAKLRHLLRRFYSTCPSVQLGGFSAWQDRRLGNSCSAGYS